MPKGSGNYKDLDKTGVKLFPNFTRHHLITHTVLIALDVVLRITSAYCQRQKNALYLRFNEQPKILIEDRDRDQ